jgi:RHS repeat-associated protein
MDYMSCFTNTFMKRTVALMLFILGAVVPLLAQPYAKVPSVTYSGYSDLSNTKTLYVRNSLSAYCTGSTTTIKKAVLNAKLNLGDDYNYGQGNWSSGAQLTVNVTGYNSYTSNTSPLVSISQTLTISDASPEQLYSYDFTTLHGQVNRFVVTVSGASADAVVQSALRLNVSFTEDVAIAVSPTISLVSVTAQPAVVTSNPVTFNWTMCDSAPEYQLQLLRLYNTNSAKLTTEKDITSTIDWNKALTVETGNSDTYITLTIAEGRGFYLWRVRPIGNAYEGGIADSRNWGAWSDVYGYDQDDVEIIDSTMTSVPCLFFYEQFNDSINWIYGRTFVEGDAQSASQVAIGESMTYANPLMQAEQTQAHINSEQKVLVGATVYDKSGRPSLTTLPGPVQQDYLQYKQDFIKDASGARYDSDDFDLNSNYLSPSLMDTTAGALQSVSSYYSDMNTDLTIPSANGYPYSRILYFRDGTNRPKETSSPGPMHQLNSGRTARAAYSSVSDIEMIRVLGDEAPDARSVHKVINTDANNVSSVSYISKEGQTIITCLSAGADTLLDPLPDLPSSGFTVRDTLKVNTLEGRYAMTSVKNLVFTEQTSLTLYYDITPAVYGDTCAGFCKVCDYTIVFNIHDMDNDTVLYNDTLVIDPNSYTGCSPSQVVVPSVTKILAAGYYVVERQLIAYNTNPLTNSLYIDEQDSILKLSLYNNFTAGQASVIGGPSSVYMDTINDYIDRGRLDSLYLYIGASTTDTMMYLLLGCDTLSIPVLQCPSYSCDTILFEQYLLAQQGDSLGTYLPGYSTGQFNTLIQNMLSDTLGYTCDQLWTCWEALVQSYDISQQNATSNGQAYSLLDQFLNCTGKHYRGFTTIAHGSPGYLSHAYAYFNYNTSSAHSNCETILCGSSPCPSFAGFDESDWNTFYNCIHSSPSSGSGHTTTTDIEQYAQQAEDSCRSMCQDRFTSFVSSLVDMYHAAGYAVQDYVYAGTGSPSDTIPVQQIFCEAQALVDKCSQNCDLTIYYNSGATAIDSVGSPAEILAMQQAMTWGYSLDIASGGACDSGYVPAGSTPHTLDMYISYLNNKLNTQRSTAASNGEYWNYYDALRKLNTEIDTFACFSSAADTFVYIHPAITSSFNSGFGLMKTDVVETSSYKFERTYPEQVKPGTSFNVVTKLTLKTVVSAGTAGFTDIFSNSDFTLLSGSKTITYNTANGAILAGTVLTRSYAVMVSSAASTGSVQFVSCTPSISGVSTSSLGSTTEKVVCPSIYYLFGSASQPVVSSGTVITQGNNGFKYSASASQTIDNIMDRDSADNVVSYYVTSSFDPLKSTAANSNYPVTITTARLQDSTWTGSTSLNDYTAPYYKVTICSSACTGEYSDCSAVCIKWEPFELTDSTIIEPLSCAQQTCNYIGNYLADQENKLYDIYSARLRAGYDTICLNTTDPPDNYSAEYLLNYYHYTLYYYDRAGSLIKTVAPEDVITTNASRNVHPQHPYTTEYAFNSLGQMKRQFSPDGGETVFRYDSKGRLRFSQNAKQATDNKWSYTIYDELSRIVEVGELEGLDTTQVNVRTYPATGNEIQRTITYYTFPKAGVSYYGNLPQRYLQNRVSYTCMDKDGSLSTTKDQTYTYYSYDPHGNVEWLIQDQPEVGRSYIAYEYDVISGSVLKVKYNEQESDKFFHRYSYDADKRIKTAETSVDGIIWDRDDTYEYYAHGPLKRRNIGEDKVQGLDFIYTIQGWLKGINHPTLLASKDPGSDGITGVHAGTGEDIFGMILGYYDGDFNRTYSSTASPYNSNTGNSSHLSGSPLYNGNISSWASNIGYVASGNVYQTMTGNIYRYDVLNRIKKADFRQAGTGTWVDTDQFDERFEYDANGNITSLVRHGHQGVQLAMDSLVYNYYASPAATNKLKYVSDGAADHAGYTTDINTGQGTTNYVYDEIGNLTEDAQEGITKIAWNPYGKVDTVYKSSGEKLVYLYDPSGNRVRKEVLTGSELTSKSTFYVRDASGNVMAVYERTNTSAGGGNYTATYKLTEQPIYGSSRIGQRKESITIGTSTYSGSTLPAVQGPVGTIGIAAATFQVGSPKIKATSLGNIFSQSVTALNTQTASLSTSSQAGNAGVQGRNCVNITDGCGTTIMSVYVSKSINGNTHVCQVYDGNNALLLNCAGIKANADGQSMLMKVPGSQQLYYLFTVGTDKYPYYHIIDYAQKKVISKNNKIENASGYGQTMALLEDEVGNGSSMLYLRKYASGNASIMGVPVTTTGVGAPATLATFTSGDVKGTGEIQVSPLLDQLIIANNKGTLNVVTGVYSGVGGGGELRTYTLSNDHTTLTAANTLTPTNHTAIKSVDYTQNATHVFCNVITNTATTIKRYVAALSSSTSVTSTATGDIRLGANGKMYIAPVNGTSMAVVATPEATPAVTYLTVSAGSLCGGMPLQKRALTSGVSSCINGTYTRNLDHKLYEINDHLGNVRVVITDWKQSTISGGGSPVNFTAKTEAYYNYYAFGMEQVGRNYQGSDYRYGFNGKENDPEVVSTGQGTQDYGFRLYNPALGKFLSVDPLTKEYPELTPYQFASNTPIQSIDLDGLESFHYTLQKDDKGATKLTLAGVNADFPYLWYETGGGHYEKHSFIHVHYNDMTYNFMYVKHFEQFVSDPDNPKWIEETTEYNHAVGEERMRYVDAFREVVGSIATTYALQTQNRLWASQKNLVTLKSNSPQNGYMFKSFNPVVSNGKINIQGRPVVTGTFDYVIKNDGKLVIGTGHYSLSGNSNTVMAAGQMKIVNGQIKMIDNSSGHYQPTVEQGKNAVKLLEGMGVKTTGATINLYNKEGKMTETYKAQ